MGRFLGGLACLPSRVAPALLGFDCCLRVIQWGSSLPTSSEPAGLTW